MRAGLLVLLLAGAAAPAATPPIEARKPSLPHAVEVTSASQLAKLTRDTAKSLAQAKVVRGGFVQRRYLAGLSQPLESRGRFLFARGAGIEWHTEQPFDSQFILTETGMTQRDEGGESMRISVADQPALTVVSRVFFALFALDFDALSQDFTMAGIASDPDWTLTLHPRTAALGSVFKQALVKGGATVESVHLEDANGDGTEIELHEVQYDSRELTAEERRRF